MLTNNSASLKEVVNLLQKISSVKQIEENISDKVDYKELYLAITQLKQFVGKSSNTKTIVPGKIYILDGRKVRISRRQAECATHALQGKTSKQIARALGLSFRTVDEHLTILRSKLHCINRSQLMHKVAKLLEQ